MDNKTFPQTGLVRLPEILKFLSIGKTCWWAGVRDGRFPKPVRLGRATAWRADEVRALAGYSAGGNHAA